MVLSEVDVMFTSAMQQRKENHGQGEVVAQAELLRHPQSHHLPDALPLVIDGGQKQCCFLADPGEMYCPTHKKRHHEAVIAAMADVEHRVEGIDR